MEGGGKSCLENERFAGWEGEEVERGRGGKGERWEGGEVGKWTGKVVVADGEMMVGEKKW